MRRRQKYILKQNMKSRELTIKRTRVPNFTADEKTILIKLVNKRKDVIECKATDTKSIIKKKEAWLLIEKDFNRVINVYKRDHTVLKTAWDNIKAQTRKMQVAKKDNLIKSESKSSSTPSPLQKEKILRMVEQVASINTSKKLIRNEEDPNILSNEEVNNDINVNKHPPLLEEVKNYLDSEKRVTKETKLSIEESDAVSTNRQTCDVDLNCLSFDIDIQLDNSCYVKSEDSNDETIENSPVYTICKDDPIYRETDLFLKSLKLKYNKEHQILKAKLQTALLEQQAAELNLEAVKLDLELLSKRLKN